jgi:hypothetical protein
MQNAYRTMQHGGDPTIVRSEHTSKQACHRAQSTHWPQTLASLKVSEHHKITGEIMNKIERNPDFNGLRVRVVAGAGTPLIETHPNHPSRKPTEEIPPSEAHGGLRVKTIRLPDHAREALSALGDPKKP